MCYCLSSWSTHWFSVEVRVPDEWVGKEVRLRWDSGGEAMVWIQGEPLQVRYLWFEVCLCVVLC